MISKLQTPTKNFDEYDIFSKSLNQINKLRPQIIENWMGKLSENERSIWNDLIHVRRIKVNFQNSSYDIPRRILKIKSSK